jgi:GWxTD domain-containing protein
MPMSLMNPDLAIDALEHLFSKTAFDSLKEKSEKLKIISFFNFWKERNPDSTVAFNPAMAEYYRRVDYTVRHFSTSGQFEGFKTDQGKIYILYGSPTRIDRYLKPGEGPVELWTYQKLRKRYIFADPKKIGVFSLIEIKPI